MDASRARAIDTVEDLRRHLQWAIELEHSTIPPYLYALYSLDPSLSSDAVQVIGGVVAEEMLHLALAANLLNAVGGQPAFDTPELLPAYPHPLPYGDRSLYARLAHVTQAHGQRRSRSVPRTLQRIHGAPRRRPPASPSTDSAPRGLPPRPSTGATASSAPPGRRRPAGSCPSAPRD
jgi:hypothetical protein